MSSDSSRESSPARRRPPSPGSDSNQSASSGGSSQPRHEPSASSGFQQYAGTSASAFQSSAGTSAYQPPAGTSLSAFKSSPYTYSAKSTTTTPILRQPVGFGGTVPKASSTYSASATAAPATEHTPDQGTAATSSSKSKSEKTSKSKDKEKVKSASSGKGKEKAKPSSSHRGREKEKETARHPSDGLPSGAPPVRKGVVPSANKTTFRVHNYTNDPSAARPSPVPTDGPYKSDYRAVPAPHGREAAHPTTANPDLEQEPRRSYYRHDYERQRDNAPARRRAKVAAAENDAPVPVPTPALIEVTPPTPIVPPSPTSVPAAAHGYAYPPTPASAYSPATPVTHSHAQVSTSSHRHRHASPTGYARVSTPAPAHVQTPSRTYARTPGLTSEPMQAYATPSSMSSPTPAYSQPPTPMADRRSFDHSKPLEDSYRPSSPPSNRAYSTPERYHGTDSHAHSSHSHYPSTSPSKSYVPHTPVPPSLPPLASITSQQPIRYLRVLTLLIEDNRNGQTENQLAELRVELRESPDGCYLADAKDICDALQSSPSRIDGSAKVFTMRGKYRHYFLRLTSEGEMECSPVNLTVTMDRTIEIFIEDNPMPGASSHLRLPSLVERDMLTPITDPMKTPSPAANSQLMAPLRVDMVAEREYSDQRHRKRHRSSSSRSIDYPALHYPSHEPPPRSLESTPFSHASSPPISSSYSYMSSPQPSPTSQTSSLPQAAYLAPTSPHSAQAGMRHKSPTAFGTTPTQQDHLGHQYDESYQRRPSSPKRPRIDHAHLGVSNDARYAWDDSRTRSTLSSSLAPPTSMIPVNPRSDSTSMLTPQSEGNRTPSSHGRIPTSHERTPSTHEWTRTYYDRSYSSHERSNAPIPSELVAESTTAMVDSVGAYLRSIVSQEPQWQTFVDMRNRICRMSELLEQYRYMKRMFDRFVSQYTPSDLKDAPSVQITRAQVLKAYNLPTSWGDNCMEVLSLVALYGPNGKRYEDRRVVDMFDEVPPVTTKLQLEKFLALLRECHSRWTIDHPEF